MNASFDVLGALPPQSPVVLSVPHAGRDYPAALLAALRVHIRVATALEDRHVDGIAHAARGVRTTIVARRARAWIDLNRSEDERDTRVDEGARVVALAMRSAKVRSGLGLVPRRATNAGDLWLRRFSDAEIVQRIVEDHRPYHNAVAQALAAARARFGVAVLLDLHSMPSLGRQGPRIVIGDRFGRSAHERFVARVEAAAVASGHQVARNAPYAGGHILDAHGAPTRDVHAIQLELDRSLYLDTALDCRGPGFAATVAIVAYILDALEDEALGRGSSAMAAE